MDAAHSIGALRRWAVPRRGSRDGLSGLALALLVLGLASLCPSQPARAGGSIYAYTDEEGVTHYTNRPLGDNRYERVVFRNEQRLWRPAPAYSRYDELIDETARVYRVPPALVKAVIAAE